MEFVTTVVLPAPSTLDASSAARAQATPTPPIPVLGQPNRRATRSPNAMNTFGGMLKDGGQNGGADWSEWNQQSGGWNQNGLGW